MIQAEYVGIDVAKDKFDVALHVNNRYQHAIYSNDLKGHTEFALSGLFKIQPRHGFVWKPRGIIVKA